MSTLRVEIHIHDGLGMSLNRPLEIPTLPVPDLDTRILARAGQYIPCRMESYAGDGCSVGGECMSGGCAG